MIEKWTEEAIKVKLKRKFSNDITRATVATNLADVKIDENQLTLLIGNLLPS